MRKHQTSLRALFFSNDLLGFFIGYHAAGATSFGWWLLVGLTRVWVQALAMSSTWQLIDGVFFPPIPVFRNELLAPIGETLVQRERSEPDNTAKTRPEFGIAQLQWH